MYGRLFFRGLVAMALMACGGGTKPPKPTAGKPAAKGAAAKVKPPKPAEGDWVRGKRIYFTTPKSVTIWLQFNVDGTVDVHHGKVGSFTAKGKDVAVEIEDGKDSVIHFTKAGVDAGENVEVTQDGKDVTLKVAKVAPAAFTGTVARMKTLAGQPLSTGEAAFAGRRKGEYSLREGEPVTALEVIYRADHTCTILHLNKILDEDGTPIPGQGRRNLTHGIWHLAGNQLFFLNLIFDGDQAAPEADLRVVQHAVVNGEAGKVELTFPGGQDGNGGDRQDLQWIEEPVKLFQHREMLPYNAPEALQSFPLLETYQKANQLEPEDE